MELCHEEGSNRNIIKRQKMTITVSEIFVSIKSFVVLMSLNTYKIEITIATPVPLGNILLEQQAISR